MMSSDWLAIEAASLHSARREQLPPHELADGLTPRAVGLYGGFIRFAGSEQTFTVPYMGFVGQWPSQGPQGAITAVCSGAAHVTADSLDQLELVPSLLHPPCK